MKSQINLLHDEFVPKFEWVTGNHLLGLIALAVVICIFAYGGLWHVNGQASEELEIVKSKLTQQQSTIDELATSLAQRTSDPILESRLANLRNRAHLQSQLLNQLKGLSKIENRSFSSLFDSFSQADSKDLWLTQFEVGSENLFIQGHMGNPTALPLWISKLSDTEFFKQQEFDIASLQRTDNILVFELTSAKSEDEETSQTIAKAGVLDD